jgi:hypothetical protein
MGLFVKAKHLFRSIFTSAKLACTSGDQLGENASPAEVEVVISLTIHSIPPFLFAINYKKLVEPECILRKGCLVVASGFKKRSTPGFGEITGKAFRDPL